MGEEIVLVAGDWRKGVDLDVVDYVDELVSDTETIGEFPLMHSEDQVVFLARLLDAYDKAYEAVAV